MFTLANIEEIRTRTYAIATRNSFDVSVCSFNEIVASSGDGSGAVCVYVMKEAVDGLITDLERKFQRAEYAMNLDEIRLRVFPLLGKSSGLADIATSRARCGTRTSETIAQFAISISIVYQILG